MKKQKLFLFLIFLFLVLKSFSQGFLITQPRLRFDGDQLFIFYDIISRNPADQFYVWVEMKKTNGEIIEAKNLTGNVGDYVKAGNNNKITWIPKEDSIYLDDEIFVELKAEKYVKSFKKGSMMLLSTVFPGLGQTIISKGKPWWLTGIVAYGTLAGGYLYHQNYLKSYDSYKIEEDPVKREELFQETQRQLNYSAAFIYSGAAVWAINVFWVAVTPNRYKLLQHVNLSLNPSPFRYDGTPLLTLKVNF